MSEVLKWLEEESDRLTEESLSSADPHKTVNNSFLEGFNYALANVQGLDQPQLNKNQQQVLGWLKVGHCDGDSVFEALERITDVYEDPKTEEALESLSPDQEVQVISSFSKWALEQEEE